MENLNRLSTPNELKRSQDSAGLDDAERKSLKRTKRNVTNIEDFPPRDLIIVQDLENEKKPYIRRGQGTEDDPIILFEWETRFLISNHDNGRVFDISDDEQDNGGVVEMGEKETPQDNVDSDDERHSTSQKTSSLSLEPQTHLFPRDYLNVNQEEEEEDDNSDTAQSQNPWRKGSANPDDDSDDNPSSDVLSEQSDRDTGASISEPGNDEGKEEHEDDEDEYDDAASCIILDELILSLEHQPWTIKVKKEKVDGPEESLPELSWSQDTIEPEDLENPLSSQRSSTVDLSNTLYNNVAKGVDEAAHLQVKRELNFEEHDWDKEAPLEMRKRLFYYKYWKSQRLALQTILDRYYVDLPQNHDRNQCWLYKGPRLPNPPAQTIRIRITFKHNCRLQKLTINIVLIAMLLEGLLTDNFKEGIIKHEWQASHLCGNWTCLNPWHIFPEPGTVNLNRSPCLRRQEQPCAHEPACRKDLQIDHHLLRPAHFPIRSNQYHDYLKDRTNSTSRLSSDH